MIFEYFKMATASIRSARFRSALTMFGIIIGVSSVMTIVGLGEGVKQQVATQVSEISDSLLVVRPGKRAAPKPFSLDSIRFFNSATGSLSEKDWRDIEGVEGVESAVPIGVLSGVASYDGTEYSNGNIVASVAPLPELLNQPIEYGEFFAKNHGNRRVAVIGRGVAEDLFKENVPIGKSLEIRGKKYVVQGVFEQQKSGSFSVFNVNNSIIIPYDSVGPEDGTVQISQIYVEADFAEGLPVLSESIRQSLKTNHAGQEDFTILEREEALEVTNGVFYQLTVFTAGVAFISFIVGGIGIMNIMFATVSERKREIGIRKAIGATNVQILGQFVMESIVLSSFGAFIGVVVSYIANGVIRVTTDLQPVTTIEVIAIVCGLSIATGVVSGFLPAAKAARKDPIESLRSQN